jgi:thioesterase domain-containing protein
VVVSGYSFGGFMAFETARRLLASGRDVGLVILFDSYVGRIKPSALDLPAPAPKRYPLIPRVAPQPGEGMRAYLERLTFQVLVKARRLEAARRLANWCSGHTDIEQNDIRRRRMLELMRGGALRHWRPESLSAPVLLITSDDYHAWSDVEIWPQLCPDLTVRHVGGSHVGLFRTEALPEIGDALLTALARLNPGTSDRVAA